MCTSEQAQLTQGLTELGTAPLARSLLAGVEGKGTPRTASPPLGGPGEPCGEQGARGRLLFTGALQPLGHKTSTEQRVASNCKRKGKKKKEKINKLKKSQQPGQRLSRGMRCQTRLLRRPLRFQTRCLPRPHAPSHRWDSGRISGSWGKEEAAAAWTVPRVFHRPGSEP